MGSRIGYPAASIVCSHRVHSVAQALTRFSAETQRPTRFALVRASRPRSPGTAKGGPERHDRGADRDHDREHDPCRIVLDEGRDPHRRHAGLVHAGDAKSHRQARCEQRLRTPSDTATTTGTISESSGPRRLQHSHPSFSANESVETSASHNRAPQRWRQIDRSPWQRSHNLRDCMNTLRAHAPVRRAHSACLAMARLLLMGGALRSLAATLTSQAGSVVRTVRPGWRDRNEPETRPFTNAQMGPP